MIKINLLPHREEKRKQLKNDFYTLLLMAAFLGGFIVVSYGAMLSRKISVQTERNALIKKENAVLDDKIKEIATLKQEIDALKARQQAVEDLQGDRNQPVYLLDELVKWTPEGIHLRTLKQEGQRILLSGYAQSNERVSEYLRNLGSKSPWMNKPDLQEIRSTIVGQGRDSKRVFDFTINVGIKRPREREAEMASAAATTASQPTAPASAPVAKP